MHTCAKPHRYRHILIHVTTCLDINFYLPFTVQYVLAMTIIHLRQADLINSRLCTPTHTQDTEIGLGALV